MRPGALLLTVLIAAAAPGAAQTPRGIGVPSMDAGLALRVADDAHVGLRPLDAFRTLQEHLRENPGDYEGLWRASRETVTLGMLAVDADARRRWYRDAEDYGRRAVKANPEGVAGHQWLAMALGRRALDAGPRARVRLARQIRAEGLRTLELDSLNAAAHHVLGEWHAGIRRLSPVSRWVARRLLGADLFDDASWEAAEAHLRRAVELEPAALSHHVALARLLLDTGRDEEARLHLREVLERPAVEPTDPLQKQEAQRLLAGR